MSQIRRDMWNLRANLRATSLRKIWVWRRHNGLDPSDVFLACYPRSGSNWLQFLIYQAVTSHDPTFRAVHQFSPYIGRHRDAHALLPGDRRLIKTHETYHSSYKNAILLVRDPRDVVLSDYRYLRMRGDYDGDLAEFVSEFISGRSHGFGSWKTHTESWIASSLPEINLLKITYEDLREDPPALLLDVLGFLGVDSSTLNLAVICRNNTIEKMREKEDRDPDALTKRHADYRFVNRGVVGRWQEELTQVQIDHVEEAFGEAMLATGYSIGDPTKK